MFIYTIINNINGKKYVGLTTKSLEERFKNHKNQKTCGIGPAIKKYGIENFNISLIDTASTLEELKEKEIYWIQQLNPEYNRTKGSYGLFGYIHTEETKIKISNYMKRGYESGRQISDPTGYNLKKYADEKGNAFLGKKHTEDYKLKKSEKMKQVYNSPEGKVLKEKIASTLKSKKIKPPINTHTKNTIWWNDGVENKRSKNCPGEGFVQGRLKWKNENV